MAILPRAGSPEESDAEQHHAEPIIHRDYAFDGPPTTTTLSLEPIQQSADDDSDQDIEFEAVGGEEDLADAPKPKQVVENGENAEQGNIEIVLERSTQASTREKGKGKVK